MGVPEAGRWGGSAAQRESSRSEDEHGCSTGRSARRIHRLKNRARMSFLVVGQKVRYLPQREWGVGHLLRLEDHDTKALVIFPAREGGPILVANRQGALKAVALEVGDAIVTSAGK